MVMVALVGVHRITMDEVHCYGCWSGRSIVVMVLSWREQNLQGEENMVSQKKKLL